MDTDGQAPDVGSLPRSSGMVLEVSATLFESDECPTRSCAPPTTEIPTVSAAEECDPIYAGRWPCWLSHVHYRLLARRYIVQPDDDLVATALDDDPRRGGRTLVDGPVRCLQHRHPFGAKSRASHRRVCVFASASWAAAPTRRGGVSSLIPVNVRPDGTGTLRATRSRSDTLWPLHPATPTVETTTKSTNARRCGRRM